MTPDEITRLRAEYDRIGRVLDEIDGAEVRRAWREQEGKCYKRLVSMGITYCTVVGASDSCWPIAFEFRAGRTAIKIEFRTSAPNPDADDGYVEISCEEFDAAWRDLCMRVSAIDPHVLIEAP